MKLLVKGGTTYRTETPLLAEIRQNISLLYDHYIIIIFKHLTPVFLTDIYTTTLTISTSLELYLYMDIWKIK